MPIGFAFVVYGFDRLEQMGRLRGVQMALTLAVIGLALARARAVTEISFYSGHALFIAYMLLTGASRTARVTALVVLADVLWMKVGLLHDPTVWGGLAAGAMFAAVHRWLGRS